MKMRVAMKRALTLAMVLALLTGIFGTIGALAAGGSYYCTGDRVNLREGPSSSYASKAKLKKGDVVTYVSSSNGWYKVHFYKRSTNTTITGYVYRKYLSSMSTGFSKAGSKSGTFASVGNVYKTRVNLRVRSKPSVSKGYVKTKLKAGTKVTVMKQEKSWVYVAYKGGSGWVSAKYLKKVKK